MFWHKEDEDKKDEKGKQVSKKTANPLRKISGGWPSHHPAVKGSNVRIACNIYEQVDGHSVWNGKLLFDSIVKKVCFGCVDENRRRRKNQQRKTKNEEEGEVLFLARKRAFLGFSASISSGFSLSTQGFSSCFFCVVWIWIYFCVFF
jgi:hypothetical protein